MIGWMSSMFNNSNSPSLANVAMVLKELDNGRYLISFNGRVYTAILINSEKPQENQSVYVQKETSTGTYFIHGICS